MTVLLFELPTRWLFELLRSMRRFPGERIAEGLSFWATPISVSLRTDGLPEKHRCLNL
jgi:hypothetical protein